MHYARSKRVLDEVKREVEGADQDEEMVGRVLHKAWTRTLPSIELALWDTLPNYEDMHELSVENWKNKVHDIGPRLDIDQVR